MKHSELRHQPRHVNPRIQVTCDLLHVITDLTGHPGGVLR